MKRQHVVGILSLKILLLAVGVFYYMQQTQVPATHARSSNDDFLDSGFWASNPTDAQIIDALYGDGSGGVDRTAYTSGWTDVLCDTGAMSVVYVPSYEMSGVVGLLPDVLSGNTIYVLSTGSHIITGISAYGNMVTGNCTAIIGVGGTGDVSFYTYNGIFGNGLYGMFTLNQNKNIIVDNVRYQGLGYGGSGGIHGRNYGGFDFVSLENSSFNNFGIFESVIGDDTAALEVRGNSHHLFFTNFQIQTGEAAIRFHAGSSNNITFENFDVSRMFGYDAIEIGYTAGFPDFQYFTLRNGTIHDNNSRVTAVWLGTMSSGRFENLEIYNNNGVGIGGSDFGGGNIQNSMMRNINSHNNGKHGMFLRFGSNNITGIDIIASNNGESGIVSYTDNLYLNNIETNNNVYYGMSLNGTIVSLYNSYSEFNGQDGINLSLSNKTFLNNIVSSNNVGNGIYISAGGSGSILNNLKLFNNGGHGFFTYMSDSVINNCSIFNNTSIGMNLNTFSRMGVNNCAIFNNQKGIYMASATNSSFSNLYIGNHSSIGIESLQSTNNNYNNIRFINNAVGIQRGSASDINNKRYGEMMFVGNDFNCDLSNCSDAFLSAGTIPPVGTRQPGYLSYLYPTPSMTCDFIVNPLNIYGSGLFNHYNYNSFCNTRGRINSWSASGDVRLLYFPNINYQQQPVWYNGSTLGLTGLAYYSGLFVGDVYTGYTGLTVNDGPLYGSHIDILSSTGNPVVVNNGIRRANSSGPFLLYLETTEPGERLLTGDFIDPYPTTTGYITGVLYTGLQVTTGFGVKLLTVDYHTGDGTATGEKRTHQYGVYLHYDFESPVATLGGPLNCTVYQQGENIPLERSITDTGAGASGAYYFLGTGAGINPIMLSGIANGTSVLLTGLATGTYYWNIIAIDKLGNGSQNLSGPTFNQAPGCFIVQGPQVVQGPPGPPGAPGGGGGGGGGGYYVAPATIVNNHYSAPAPDNKCQNLFGDEGANIRGFDDINQQLAPYIATLLDHCVVNGKTDGNTNKNNFYPNLPVTQGEIIKMFAKTLRWELGSENYNRLILSSLTIPESLTSKFNNHWSFQFFRALYNLGLFVGIESKIGPEIIVTPELLNKVVGNMNSILGTDVDVFTLTNQTITRGEFAKFLVESFPDVFEQSDPQAGTGSTGNKMKTIINNFLMTKSYPEKVSFIEQLIEALNKMVGKTDKKISDEDLRVVIEMLKQLQREILVQVRPVLVTENHRSPNVVVDEKVEWTAWQLKQKDLEIPLWFNGFDREFEKGEGGYRPEKLGDILQKLGYANDQVRVFNTAMSRILVAFQKQNSLPETGILDDSTRNFLNEVIGLIKK